MDPGIEVGSNDVSRAAARIGLTADAVGRADPGADVLAVSTAMRGGAAARRAGVLQEHWSRRFRAWARDARAQQLAMDRSAHTYDQVDGDVEHGLVR